MENANPGTGSFLGNVCVDPFDLKREAHKRPQQGGETGVWRMMGSFPDGRALFPHSVQKPSGTFYGSSQLGAT